MSDTSIKAFFSKLHAVYGADRIELYGCADPEREHGIGFRIRGVPAIFSVVTLDGSLPNDTYEVQIESDPPGEYVFTDQLDSRQVLRLIERIVAGDLP